MNARSSIWKWIMFVCLPLWTPDTEAGQFVEVIAEIEGTFWPEQGATSRRTFSTRCVIGTNIWMLEGDFQRNATRTYWFSCVNRSLNKPNSHWKPAFIKPVSNGLLN